MTAYPFYGNHAANPSWTQTPSTSCSPAFAVRGGVGVKWSGAYTGCVETGSGTEGGKGWPTKPQALSFLRYHCLSLPPAMLLTPPVSLAHGSHMHDNANLLEPVLLSIEANRGVARGCVGRAFWTYPLEWVTVQKRSSHAARLRLCPFASQMARGGQGLAEATSSPTPPVPWNAPEPGVRSRLALP